MEKVFIFVVLLPALALASPVTEYIEDHCGPTGVFQFGKDFLLRFSDYRSFIPAAYSCIMNVQNRAASRQIQVRVLRLDLEQKASCSAGAVVMKEGNTFLTPPYGICGTSARSHVYRTGGSQLSITLTNTGRISAYGDFKLLLTSIYNATTNSSSPSGCQGDDFRCNDGICISSQVICNGYNDCADGSDEGTGCDLAAGVIVGVVIAVLFVVFIIVSVLYCFGRRRRHFTRVTQVVREYPTVNDPVTESSYVPSYYKTTTGYQTL